MYGGIVAPKVKTTPRYASDLDTRTEAGAQPVERHVYDG
jgi:hypothetical protein